MAKTIALFGAGPGLGAAMARRFGREGYRVALVARGDRQWLVDELAGAGVEAASFRADLSEPGTIPPVVRAIRERFGGIDAVGYAPVPVEGFMAAADLTVEPLQRLANLYFFGLVQVVGEVLPEMVARGDGAILMGAGSTAISPQPSLSGPGPLMAAARNYLLSLHAEVADKGVYVGAVLVGALIANSAAHSAVASGELQLPPDTPVVSPGDIAELYWDMYAKRDTAENSYPSIG